MNDASIEIENAEKTEIRGSPFPYTGIENGLIDSESVSMKAKMTYIVLRRFANWNTGQCFPSIPKIAKLAGISDNTVKVALRELADLGLVTWEIRKEGDRNKTHLFNTMLFSESKLSRGGSAVEPSAIHEMRRGGSAVDPGVDQQLTEGGSAVDPELILLNDINLNHGGGEAPIKSAVSSQAADPVQAPPAPFIYENTVKSIEEELRKHDATFRIDRKEALKLKPAVEEHGQDAIMRLLSRRYLPEKKPEKYRFLVPDLLERIERYPEDLQEIKWPTASEAKQPQGQPCPICGAGMTWQGPNRDHSIPAWFCPTCKKWADVDRIEELRKERALVGATA
jgi:hypothetical protein